MRRASALLTVLALLLAVPALLVLSFSCGDAEGTAKLYENPSWPCRPDAISGPSSEICWQRCQAHQTWEAAGDGESGACVTNGSDPDWGHVADLATSRELCKGEDYHTPSYADLLSLLDNCEDVGEDFAADGGPTDGGAGSDAGVHVEQYLCERCFQSDVCSSMFPGEMHVATYWSETRCPREGDDPLGDPDEDWRGRWVIDFGTGESFCVRSTDEYSALCVNEAPDPWPPTY